MKFFLTKHCKERYVERVQNGLNPGGNILMTILNDLNEAKDITDKIYRECPRYILHLHEKYKEAGQRILQKDNILFIGKKRPGTGTPGKINDGIFDVFTCYNQGYQYLANFKSTVLNNEDIYIKIKQVKKLNRA